MMNSLLFALSCVFLNVLRVEGTSPADHGVLLWSEKLDGVENNVSVKFAHGHIYVSSINCGVHILDLDGKEIGKIEGTTGKTCPSGLSFANDLSFFVLAGFYEDENENT
jgi:hypothetical protein